MSLREVSSVGSDFVSNYPFLNVVAVWKAKVFLGRHVTQHSCTEPADHGGSNTRCNVVVPRCNVCGQRTERVKRCFATNLKLFVHVDLDLVHWHVTRSFYHHLATFVPGDCGEFPKGFKFSELSGVIGVGNRSRSQSVAKGEADIVSAHDVAHLLKMGVKKVFLMVG